jgi:hypothetical protein
MMNRENELPDGSPEPGVLDAFAEKAIRFAIKPATFKLIYWSFIKNKPLKRFLRFFTVIWDIM